jgi:hypothetical protein
MLADFFTKPLQGSLFRRLRDVVMGQKHIHSLSVAPSGTTTQERVEKDDRSERESGVADSDGTSESNQSVRVTDRAPTIITIPKKVTFAEIVTSREVRERARRKKAHS